MAPVAEFCAGDVPQLKTFILEAWRLAGSSALGWTGATDENIQEISSENFLQGLIGKPNLRVFVDREGEEVLGFCAIRMVNAESVELAGIVVRQDHLSKGIGSALLERAKTAAVESGFTTMLVKTESTNDRALLFYGEKGFVEQKKVVEDLNNAEISFNVLRLDLRKT